MCQEQQSYDYSAIYIEKQLVGIFLHIAVAGVITRSITSQLLGARLPQRLCVCVCVCVCVC
jgi:hypothetical protein